MSTVDITVTQDKICNGRVSHCGAKFRPCGKNERKYGLKRCIIGADQYECTSICNDTCPKINGTSESKWVGNDSKLTVQCSYPLVAFNNITAVKSWVNKFGRDEIWANEIMPYFFKLKSFDIPREGIEVGIETYHYKHLDESGEECELWAKKYPEVAEREFKKYCKNNPDSPDCGCINRTSDPEFKKFKKSLTVKIDDRCWWKQCLDDSIFNPSGSFGTCPKQKCDIVNKIIENNKNINTDLIGCEDEVYHEKKISKSLIWWIAGVLVIVLLFVIFLWRRSVGSSSGSTTKPVKAKELKNSPKKPKKRVRISEK